MKISNPSNNHPSGEKGKPLLPLVPEEPEEGTTFTTRSFLLRTVPGDADSAKYKSTVFILHGGEDVRTILTWSMQVSEVCNGLGVMGSAANARPVMEAMMGSIPKTIFTAEATRLSQAAYDAALAGAADDPTRAAIEDNGVLHYATVDNLFEAIEKVTEQQCPQHVLARVKRSIRRNCRKPREMKVRTYFQHLNRINQEELPKLPPFGNDQSFADDELIDIILYGTPKSWQSEMERQGFDPIGKTPLAVITFLERIEAAEDLNKNSESPASTPKKKGASKKNAKKAKMGKSNDESGESYCLLHGNGNHSTDECFKLQEQAKQLKGEGGKSKNKTWSRKAEDGKKDAKQELAAFVKKAIHKGVKKQLASIDKKRKATKDAFAFEEILDGNLKGFNYQDMENLNIDSDDEWSV